MKLWLQNYTFTRPTANRYMKGNNNKINSLQIFYIAQNYTKQFSICLNITLKFRNTSIFKTSIKENND
jgi:hypothetical protein